MIRRFERNTTGGRDLIVGDIHGCFSNLWLHLRAIGFNPATDRLFSVGDLVDRGPESSDALEWLEQPWFHAVSGNHEQMAIDAAAGPVNTSLYIANGGAWFLGMTPPERRLYADAFSTLPVAIELETAHGLLGIVHAECPTHTWADLRDALLGPHRDGYVTTCHWGRDRYLDMRDDLIPDVRAVIVGHTPVRQYTSLGNTIYIDTGAVFQGGQFTVLDADTLRPAVMAKLAQVRA